MDILYTVNSGSQDLLYGTTTGGAFNILPLGFACYRMAVINGQRFLYITGNKTIGNDPHAWLAVVDTCTNSVSAEVDLGIGFAGQCATPPGANGEKAFVAVSKAIGSRVSAGNNRVEVLDVTNPQTPSRLANSAVNIGGSAYGVLHIVWSNTLDVLFTSHRGDNQIYSFHAYRGGSFQPPIPVPQQPMGLGISSNGLTLYVVSRLSGDIREVDLAVQPPTVGQPFQLHNANTQSGMFIAMVPQDRVLVTSSRPDGFLNIYQQAQAGGPQSTMIDTGGSRLGQPAVSPDGRIAYIPRGNQNDIAQVDLINNTVSSMFLPSGSYPTDVIALSHQFGLQLETEPTSITTPCMNPTDVTVRAYDACGNEISGVNIVATSTSNNISISSPVQQPTPATYQVECLQGGQAAVNFTTNSPPYFTKTLDVQCDCPYNRCYDFSMFQGGPLPTPGNIAGVINVSVAAPGPRHGPDIGVDSRHVSPVLRTFQSIVRFELLSGQTADNLIIGIRRNDSEPPLEQVVVTHANGVDLIPSSFGFAQGIHQIVCPFQGITEWTILGGKETYITEICFTATF